MPNDYKMTILERHLDTFGHVNNATYLEMLEEARWQIVTQNGYGLKEVQKTGQGPIILEVHLKFLKELRLREEITISTEFLDYHKKIGTIRQKIFNANEDICLEATFKIGLFDMQKRKLISPTPEWLRALGVEG